MMRIERTNGCDIWELRDCEDPEYYVYGVTAGGDPMTAPSLGMARAIAAAHGPGDDRCPSCGSDSTA